MNDGEEYESTCWCSEGRTVGILFDMEKGMEPVYSIDGDNAAIIISVSKERGIVEMPINYCPYCGRYLGRGLKRAPHLMKVSP